MLKFIPLIKKSFISSIALFLVGFFPAGIAFADSTSPAPCTPPASTSPGVHWPTGSDAKMFTYQCDGTYAGEWTSSHYVFNPANNQTTPRDPVVYTYNNQTGKWDTTVWVYSAAKNDYVQSTRSVATPPAGANTVGGPPPPSSSQDSTPSVSGGTAPTLGVQSTSTPAAASPTGTGPNSSSTLNTSTNNTTNASLSNTINGQATSGNAGVIGNTSGGNATTGSAQDIANVINMLQSSSNVLGNGNVLTFTANINGDVNGDLLLDPSTLGTIQPATSSSALNNNVTVNNSTNESINNNVTVGATSGNATVDNNTSAGNSSSGNANAVANIVNVLNSAITAGKSFFGVININGNLNGDILLPPNFVDQLLANNVPHTTITSAQLSQAVNVTNNTNQAINNFINASAASGDASVINNTTGGNATTGSANTNLTIFNLTGTEVMGTNDLLVFVNVLGQWVGLIMNAPAGSTAAELGGGIVSNANAAVNSNVNMTNNTTQTINNNITTAAQSGDATVRNNTSAGNATSGNATASINLLNLINNHLSFSNWFGLLFINVFGTWHGSFGINTSAGNPVIPPESTTTTPAPASTPPAQTFQFVPALDKSIPFTPSSAGISTTSDPPTAPTNTAVLAAKTSNSSPPLQFTTDQVHHDYWIPIAGAVIAILMLVMERLPFFHRQA